MGEVKNAFIKSKMNKDLDARLLPSGEYRNAINAQVSKSESSGVGSLENVLGNSIVVDFFTETGVNDLVSIGGLANELNNTMYIFLTNNPVLPVTQPRQTQEDYNKDGSNFIISYNTLTTECNILVKGAFLNFSALNKIYGINVLEGLLFWTDNRNQPRKINIDRAIEDENYYTIEDQISVAKYNPYQSIELYGESEIVTGEYETTMYDVISKFNPSGGTGVLDGITTSPSTIFVLQEEDVTGDIVPGASIAYVDISQNPPVLVDTGATVNVYIPGQLVTNGNMGPFTGALTDLELIFNYNKYYEPTYSGDPNFLEDKFVRFAYRFKFEDGEYSIFSPFTQTVFTPKQDGYFMYNQPTPNTFNIDVDDESAAYRSTIVEFMENKVNKALLKVPLPFTIDSMGNNGSNSLKIESIDILYKESDGLSVKVVDTITMATVQEEYGPIDEPYYYVYSYNSKKPYKTLPSEDLIRVYDKVPVKAFGQEVISNRIVYSNYQDKHTPPASLNYNLLISEKTSFNISVSTLQTSASPTDGSNNIKATLLSGQVLVGGLLTGFGVSAGSIVVSYDGTVLVTDRTQSSMLSGITLTVKSANQDLNTTSIKEYPNHSLKQNRNYQVGIVLSDKFGRSSSVILSNSLVNTTIGGVSYKGSTIYLPYRSSGTDSHDWPGDSLKILFNDAIGTNIAVPSTGEPGQYNGDSTSVGYNPLGWYSYKVVVKQTEQEYYNVYLPGVLAGYPRDSTLEVGKTSFAVLLNDNINKVPRDLSEVGPQQKQFRSSVQLFGRVENNTNPPTTVIPTANTQYFPGIFSSTVSTIATNNDLFNADDDLQYIATTDFYEIESNPLIAKISTNKKFGVVTSASNALTSTSTTNATTILVDNVQGIPLAGDIVRGVGVTENTQVVSYNGTTDVIVDRQQSLSDNTFLTFTAQNASSEYSLAVFETSPVESNLDIFWESSSSGSVSVLNAAILTESNGAAAIGNWSVGTFNESVGNPQSVTGSTPFNILDAAGSIIPAGDIVSVNLTSVKTMNATPVEVANRFSNALHQGNGTYKVNTVVPANTSNFDWVYGNNAAQNKSFTFYFDVVTTNGTSNFTTQLIETAPLGNSNPVFVESNGSTTASCPADVNIGTSGEEIVHTFYGVNGANISQNQPTSNNLGVYKGLSFSITTVDSNGNTVSPSFIETTTPWNSNDPTVPFKTVVSKPASFTTPGTYTVTLTLSDAGPANVTCVFDVIVTSNTCIQKTVTACNSSGGQATFSYTDCDGNLVETGFDAYGCGTSMQVFYLEGTTPPPSIVCNGDQCP